MIYLASPYTDSDPQTEASRFRSVVLCLAAYHRLDIPVISPIVHWHCTNWFCGLRGGSDSYWLQNQTLLDLCKGVHFLKLPGWQSSIGMAKELGYAIAKGLPMEVFELVDLSVVLNKWKERAREWERERRMLSS